MQMEVLKEKIQALGLSTACTAGLCGGSAGSLSQELAGIKPMSNAKYLRLNNDLTTLLEIQAAIAPLALDLKNVARVRSWLSLWSAGQLKIVVQDLSEVQPQPCS
jgi:hypothetical protein